MSARPLHGFFEITDRRCRVCGCTDEEPCVDLDAGGTCLWIERDLCTSCISREELELRIFGVNGPLVAAPLLAIEFTPEEHERAARLYAEATRA